MKKNDFVHLHLHTEYSLLDGACRIDKLFNHIKSIGQEAVAITDHGCMYGAVEFYKTAKKYNIKAIIGCEVYVARRTRFDREHKLDSSPYHLILLCKNETGYRNLIKMVSVSNLEGFYSKPRIDYELLEKYHEGLICLSGCMAGEVARNLLNLNYDSAKLTVEKYRKIFGDDYYIEVQNHKTDDDFKLLPQLYRLSEETGIPLVATNDCHYIEKSDSDMQKTLLCIQINKSIYEKTDMFSGNESYVKSTEEMFELFKGHEQAVLNTSLIAEKCSFEFEFGNIKIPEFRMDGVSDNNIFFRKLCTDGMYKRYGKNPSPEVTGRLEHELNIITETRYTDYYLIVWDFVKYAKTHNIAVGAGRGSGAGSLCAYCIEITDIDPVKYNLLFERFLNPERLSMPDFDIDFCIEERQKVKDYVIERYGKDKVSEIIAFDTLKARASVRDVGRVMKLPYKICDETAKIVGDYNNLTEALQNDERLQSSYKSDASVHKLIDMAMRIEGMPRHATTHAAGVVISAFPLSDIVPLQKNDETVVTQYTMTELEQLGLLKMDFLGLRNLTVIRDTVNKIRQYNPDFDISKIPVDDKKVYSMMSSGNLSGVFQFESQGIRNLVMKLKPDNIEDIIAIISLYRPGPMDSIPLYIKNRNNPENVKYKHPSLENILKNTYGCIIYQEQVMEICRKLAGFSYGHADIVRHAMSKKKHDVMMKEKNSFIEGAIKNNISYEVAESIFDEMSGFASYAFNRSHSAAYAYIAYQTAYLKCHYFKEYMASLMSSVMSNNTKLLEYISLCRAEGTEIMKPDINISSGKFSVSENSIYFGLLAIKNVGSGMVEKIIHERQLNGNYRSFQDFCERTSGREINKRAVENMIKAGVFDNLDLNRHQMLEHYESIMNSVLSGKSSEIEGQLNFLDLEGSTKHNIRIPMLKEYERKILLRMEKEASGLYLSGNPLNDYEHLKVYLKTVNIKSIEPKEGLKIKLLCSLQTFRIHTAKDGRKMSFLVLEDETDEIEAVVFPDVYKNCSSILKEDNILFINGHISLRNDKASIICDEIYDTDDTEKLLSEMNFCIKMSSDNISSFAEINKIFGMHYGKTRVFIYLTDKRKMISPNKPVYISVDENFYRDIVKVISPNNIGLIK